MFSSMSAEYRFQYGFQVMGMIKRFLGFEILIPGFFWLGKFGKYSFGQLKSEVRFFDGIFLVISFKTLWKLRRLRNPAGNFGGVL